MHNQLFPLLNAYLDGELRGTRLRDMERHLDSCAICQRELDDLRRVSDLVRAAPQPAFTSADRFAANLTLLLPRRPQQSQPQRTTSPTWWLIPAGLIGLLFFIQTVFTLSNIVRAADATGLLSQVAPWLSEGQAQATWFTATSSLFGAQMNANQHSTLSALNQFTIFSADWLQGLIWQAGLVLLCIGWFVVWNFMGEASTRTQTNL